MKRFKRTFRAFAFVLAALTLGGFGAFATTEKQDAVVDITERGIYQGDENGDLNVDKGLTRAELAVILTRLDFTTPPLTLDDWDGESERYADDLSNPFTDVPDWAVPYVEYCYVNGLMIGVGETEFNPQESVNPKMVCTVILRWLEIAETDWDYGTSLVKARELGLTNGADVYDATITRGDTALVIGRGINRREKAGAAKSAVPLAEDEEMKAEVVRLMNREREKAGLAALEVLPELAECAQVKALDIVDDGYYSHDSPTFGMSHFMIKEYVPERLSSGEVLVFRDTPAEAFAAWMNSEPHRANLLFPVFTHTGVGTAVNEQGNRIWVQQFVELD